MIHPHCYHDCTSNCRRKGCNCLCAEFHGYYEPERGDIGYAEYLATKAFTTAQERMIARLKKDTL